MKALIFVYSKVKFRIGGAHALKQMEVGKEVPYDEAPTRAGPGDTPTLDPGVYGIYLDSDQDFPAIAASEGMPGVDYDIVVYAGKDKWPDPPLATTVHDWVVANARERISGLVDEKINLFIYDEPRAGTLDAVLAGGARRNPSR